MMLAVMYGMMPEREDREAPERAAGEQVEEAERALRLDALLELLDRDRVDARHPDGDAQSVQGDHHHENRILFRRSVTLKTFFRFDSTGDSLVGSAVVSREYQRLVNWLPLTGGRPCLKGSGNSVTLPPAAVMAASAAFETAWA